MRVLVVHNRYRSDQPSGENAVVDAEVELLAGHGVDVRVLAVESDDIARWPVHRRALLPARVVWSRTGYRLVADAVSRLCPDVVHFHNTFPLLSPAALRAAKGSGAGVVQTLHNYRPLCPAATFFRDGAVCEDCLGRAPWPGVLHGCYRGSVAATVPVAAMDMVHRGLRTHRSVDAFLSPSAFTRAKYVQAGWPAGRIHVKYNTAVDPHATRDGPGDGFLCLGRLVPEKGIDVLLAAWAEAFPGSEETLTIAGAGDAEAALSGPLRSTPGVRFVGRVAAAEVPGLMRRARAVVVPSRWHEVFGRTVVEAYALGVPVVASRAGGLAEIVDDGTTGIAVEPGSRGSLAVALRRLASDGALAERMGAAARRMYEARFSPAVTTERLLEIYGDVAARPRATAVAGGAA